MKFLILFTKSHVRDTKGTPWHTVIKGTEYANRGMGENLVGRTLPYNVYRLFSEKIIANHLYNQWKNFKGQITWGSTFCYMKKPA